MYNKLNLQMLRFIHIESTLHVSLICQVFVSLSFNTGYVFFHSSSLVAKRLV